MRNLADIIEQLILQKLAGEDEDVILKRNELADELACAPSQISYVLSTRFTFQRGFIVESRRGSGGFVRIAKIPISGAFYSQRAPEVEQEITLADIADTIYQLAKQGMITGREAMLLNRFFEFTNERISRQANIELLRSLLFALAAYTDKHE